MKKQRLQHWIFVADLLWMLIAMFAAYVLRYGFFLYSSGQAVVITFLPLIFACCTLWALLFSRMKLDGFRLGWHFPAIVSELFLATAAVLATLMALSFLTGHYVSRTVLAYWAVIIFCGFVIIRRVAYAVLQSKYLKRTVRRVVIVGNGPVAREMYTKLQRHPEMLCQVVGHLCSADNSLDNQIFRSRDAVAVQTLGVLDLLREYRVDEIIITATKRASPELTNLVAQCRGAGIAVSLVPHPYQLYLSTPQLLDIGGLPVLKLDQAHSSFANGGAKRLFDLVLTCGFLPLTLPLVLLGAIGLLRRKPAPFSRELRCGLHSKTFWMYRLNSTRDAPNLPLFERILQQLSITELPQLWNVLRGEMSLVGPRPESPERVKHYSEWQRQRLNVSPGITGLAQVHGLREQHSSEEKARFDLQYMLHASPFSDLSLLLQTGWTIAARVLHLAHLRTAHSEGMGNPMAQSHLEVPLSNAHRSQPSAH